jgi:hypothetical protein
VNDTLTPEQVEAIGDHLANANGLALDESVARWYRKDVAALLADHDALTAEVERLLAPVEPCICHWTPDMDGPAEDCPQHGRPYSDWVGAVDTLELRVADMTARAEAAERKVAAVRAVVTGPLTGENTTEQWFATIRALLDTEAH